MNVFNNNYIAHWVIGISAAIVWAIGKQVGLDPLFISFASLTLPVVVGHALGTQRNVTPSGIVAKTGDTP